MCAEESHFILKQAAITWAEGESLSVSNKKPSLIAETHQPDKPQTADTFLHHTVSQAKLIAQWY